MRARDLERIAKPTIAEVFEEFLAEHRARLSDRTFRNYEDVLDLFTDCLDGYAYECLDQSDSALFDRLYEAEGEDHREFTEIFGPERILPNFHEFLGYFMIRKVIAGKGLLRAAGTVTKKLAKWLAARGYAEDEDAMDAAEAAAAASRNLLAAEDLVWMLDDCCESPSGASESVEGHFTFTRVEPGKIWAMDLAGAECGPILLPPEVTELCPVGWTLSGAIARRGKSWRIAEVWNVYPRR